MAKAGRVQHWKHGWIPISPEAKAYVAGKGPLPSSFDGPGPALPLRGFDDLSPGLQDKIKAKLTEMTGMPERGSTRRATTARPSGTPTRGPTSRRGRRRSTATSPRPTSPRTSSPG